MYLPSRERSGRSTQDRWIGDLRELGCGGGGNPLTNVPSSDLITLPSPSAIFISIASSSQPTFNEFISFGLVEVGIFIGAVVVIALVLWITGAFGMLLNMGRRSHTWNGYRDDGDGH